jgi:hypothetical protein
VAGQSDLLRVLLVMRPLAFFAKICAYSDIPANDFAGMFLSVQVFPRNNPSLVQKSVGWLTQTTDTASI